MMTEGLSPTNEYWKPWVEQAQDNADGNLDYARLNGHVKEIRKKTYDSISKKFKGNP